MVVQEMMGVDAATPGIELTKNEIVRKKRGAHKRRDFFNKIQWEELTKSGRSIQKGAAGSYEHIH
jgi:hypothetical protein